MSALLLSVSLFSSSSPLLLLLLSSPWYPVIDLSPSLPPPVWCYLYSLCAFGKRHPFVCRQVLSPVCARGPIPSGKADCPRAFPPHRSIPRNTTTSVRVFDHRTSGFSTKFNFGTPLCSAAFLRLHTRKKGVVGCSKSKFRSFPYK